MKQWLFLVLAASLGPFVMSQSKSEAVDKFRQLEEILPTPNTYRTASGAPGHRYWQQRADVTMTLTLDDKNQRLVGSETIVYANNSPDVLRYLWLQLDQNRFEPDSDDNKVRNQADMEDMSYRQMRSVLERQKFAGGFKITAVSDDKGKPLPHTIVKTMMRIDLPEPLRPGSSTTFSVDWNYNIIENKVIGGRAGYEYFEKEDNYLYEIAQFFPRMAAYTDVNGWQHKQFLGGGEFTLELGDYRVSITAPSDHVVGASGVLQNPKSVLTAEQRKRLDRAKKADKPVLIITPEEALSNEGSRATDSKTWVFQADNVRDFAFVSSRKFIWDAQGYDNGEQTVMAMSYYPKEGNPLWERYSTASIIHTLRHYDRYAFTYPYPVAISVNGPVGGMEYPMICFNGPRPEDDGTYTARTKYGLISVIIHEVGHNYFPMIVNSDERQWTWMDEGLNTFLQFLAEQAWEEDYPSRRGHPQNITAYMASERQVPIMTNSESLLQFGNNAYAKPATALNILRETVLGRDLFDFAFREYSRRWKFKRPMPADFFRTMEDASGVDLDWFWRGWFYTTDHTDIALENITHWDLNSLDPDQEKPKQREQDREEKQNLSRQRNKGIETALGDDPGLADFYNQNDAFTVTPKDREEYKETLAALKPEEKKLLALDQQLYTLEFKNVGGLVMPVLLEITYEDHSKEMLHLPAEIWRKNHQKAEKLLVRPKQIVSVTVDPLRETADVDLENNHFPRKPIQSRFKLFKKKKAKNLMQKMNPAAAPAAAKEKGEEKADKSGSDH